MITETTCLYTADRHWIRMDELLKHPFVPLMCWRHGKFRPTQSPCEVKVIDREAFVYRISNVYQIDLVLTYNHKVPTPRGLMSISSLTDNDEVYLYMGGEMRLTRPTSIKREGHRRVYWLSAKEAFALVARDVTSRWKSAFDIGLLMCDYRASGNHARKIIPRTLPPSRSCARRREWKPPLNGTL